MKNFLKLLGSVLVFGVALFSLPALAANSNNKTYSLDMTVLQQGSGTQPSQLQAVVKNTSPSQSTSTFNSIDIFVDLGWPILNTVANPIVAYESNAPTIKYAADTRQAGHIKLTKLAAVTPFVISGNTLVVQFWVAAGSSGDGTWNATPYSGAQLNGNSFLRDGGQNIASVPTDTLACVTNPDVDTPTPVPGSVVAMRGEFNKDGTTGDQGSCVGVPFYASNTLNNNVGLPQNVVHFRWDQSGTDQTFSTAAFKYSNYYSGANPPLTRVGWLRVNGDLAVDPGANPNANSSNPVVFIDTPACDPNANQLPTPYGSGTLATASTQTLNFNLTGSQLTPPPPPSPQPSPPPVVGYPVDFPIYVGLERMQVQSINNDGTWTVLRGQLGTMAVPHLSVGGVDPLVMSTPLPALLTQPTAWVLLANGMYKKTSDFAPPLNNPYGANSQAQICLEGSGSSIEGVPAFNTFIDIGDGWVPVR